jgi:hypothetical protein
MSSSTAFDVPPLVNPRTVAMIYVTCKDFSLMDHRRFMVFQVPWERLSRDDVEALAAVNCRVIRLKSWVDESTYHGEWPLAEYKRAVAFIRGFVERFKGCVLEWTNREAFGELAEPLLVAAMYNFGFEEVQH